MVAKFGVETGDRVRRPSFIWCSQKTALLRPTPNALLTQRYSIPLHVPRQLPIQTRVIVHRTSLLVRTRWYNPRTMFVASKISTRQRHHLLPFLVQTLYVLVLMDMEPIFRTFNVFTYSPKMCCHCYF